jgi:hypothetical protein
MPEHLPDDERLSVLIAIARLEGQISQALTQIAAQTSRLEHYDGRLRLVEAEQATARGRAAVTGLLAGGGVSLAVAAIVYALNLFGG